MELVLESYQASIQVTDLANAYISKRSLVKVNKRSDTDLTGLGRDLLESHQASIQITWQNIS